MNLQSLTLSGPPSDQFPVAVAISEHRYSRLRPSTGSNQSVAHCLRAWLDSVSPFFRTIWRSPSIGISGGVGELGRLAGFHRSTPPIGFHGSTPPINVGTGMGAIGARWGAESDPALGTFNPDGSDTWRALHRAFRTRYATAQMLLPERSGRRGMGGTYRAEYSLREDVAQRLTPRCKEGRC